MRVACCVLFAVCWFSDEVDCLWCGVVCFFDCGSLFVVRCLVFVACLSLSVLSCSFVCVMVVCLFLLRIVFLCCSQYVVGCGCRLFVASCYFGLWFAVRRVLFAGCCSSLFSISRSLFVVGCSLFVV